MKFKTARNKNFEMRIKLFEKLYILLGTDVNWQKIVPQPSWTSWVVTMQTPML